MSNRNSIGVDFECTLDKMRGSTHYTTYNGDGDGDGEVRVMVMVLAR